MNKLRISAIRYANTFPLNYGLRESGIEEYATMEIDHPAECARKLSCGEADIGLVPIAEIRNIDKAEIISNYCIGTNSPVRTVLLVSNSPFKDIKSIFLDYRSRTSIALTRVLAREKWGREFIWQETDSDFNFKKIPAGTGLVIIGDQCFDLEEEYKYKIDLASEWKEHTGLPFVFACWVANRKIDKNFLEKFNNAMRFGIENIENAILKYETLSSMPVSVLRTYLNENIDYVLNDDKRKAMNVFFEYLDALTTNGERLTANG